MGSRKEAQPFGIFRKSARLASATLGVEATLATLRGAGVPLSANSGQARQVRPDLRLAGRRRLSLSLYFRRFPERLGSFRPGCRLEESESGLVWTSGGAAGSGLGHGIPIAEAADQAGHHLPEERPPHLHLHLLGEEESKEQWGVGGEGGPSLRPRRSSRARAAAFAFLSFPPQNTLPFAKGRERLLQREGGADYMPHHV